MFHFDIIKDWKINVGRARRASGNFNTKASFLAKAQKLIEANPGSSLDLELTDILARVTMPDKTQEAEIKRLFHHYRIEVATL